MIFASSYFLFFLCSSVTLSSILLYCFFVSDKISASFLACGDVSVESVVVGSICSLLTKEGKKRKKIAYSGNGRIRNLYIKNEKECLS